MAKHSAIKTILILAAVGGGAYYLAKKYKCSCKSGKCGCNDKSAAATATTAAPAATRPLMNTEYNSPVVTPSGLGDTIDGAIAPNSTGWHSADALEEGPVIDTVTQIVPTIGVKQFNDSPNRIYGMAPTKDIMNL